MPSDSTRAMMSAGTSCFTLPACTFCGWVLTTARGRMNMAVRPTNVAMDMNMPELKKPV